MHSTLATALGRLSRLLSRATGGLPNQTLCARIAAARGPRCLFCRIVGRLTEPSHCADELARWEAPESTHTHAHGGNKQDFT